jgi:hypothetical protein
MKTGQIRILYSYDQLSSLLLFLGTILNVLLFDHHHYHYIIMIIIAAYIYMGKMYVYIIYIGVNYTVIVHYPE